MGIEKLRLRYVVPFFFGGDGLSIREAIMDATGCIAPYGGRWMEDTVWRGEHDLYEYVLGSFNAGGGSDPSNIGVMLCYESGKESIKRFEYHSKSGNSYSFDIRDMGLDLFMSGVGLLWYEVGGPLSDTGDYPDISELIGFEYAFKELNYDTNRKVFIDADGSGPFMMGDWIARLLQPILPGVRFAAKRRNVLYDENDAKSPVFVPDKSLMYNYMAYSGDDPQDGLRAAYYLTKGYKDTHSMPSGFEGKLYRPFANVICYACTEGAGYYALATEENRTFFTGGMAGRYMGDYFVMYLLILNIHYSLISYAARIDEELPADISAYMTSDVLGLEKKVTRLMMEINLFLTKNVRATVSHIGHHNEFFDYLGERMGIDKSIEAIRQGIYSLQDVLNDMVRTEQAYRDNPELIKWRKEDEYTDLARENDRLKEEIYKDELTGLLNQKGYLKLSKEIYAKAKREQKTLFVCSVDMNGLKHINDECGGHDAGDKALRGVADMLREAALPEDHLFRKGGDEFVVLGIRYSIDCGEEKRFAEAIEGASERINSNSGLDFEIAASYGPLLKDMAVCSDGLDEIFKESDDMMYEMKVAKDKYRR